MTHFSLKSLLLFFPKFFGHLSGFAICLGIALLKLVILEDRQLFFEVLELVVPRPIVLDFSFGLGLFGKLFSFESPLIPLPRQKQCANSVSFLLDLPEDRFLL